MDTRILFGNHKESLPKLTTQTQSTSYNFIKDFHRAPWVFIQTKKADWYIRD